MTTKKQYQKYGETYRKYYRDHAEYYAKYRREYYRENREKLLVQNKANRDKKWAVMRAVKDKPCADCGGRFHFSAMDFDHVRGVKRECVARIGVGLDKMLVEMEKCEIVCSNCHRVRTSASMDIYSCHVPLPSSLPS